ncbi:MAG: cbb3-type cytochrome c oxidase N-terminal domain-containing protein [Planctomycetota bacterium]|nr:cbb3-type cytochrome c oxidase N-terminal domain-containing protein [Planctomycetota bacterium]
MAGRKEKLMGHEYDGISEYDNPTPGWWHMFFIASVFYSAVYIAFWHFSPVAWSTPQALASDERAYYGRLFADLGELDHDAPTMVRLMQDQKWMAFGQSIFVANCAQCHAADGSGINGANLTDDRWINVRKIEDIFGIVSEGVAAKGMPAWKNRLGENERVLVASYVASLRNTPRQGRAAEGEPIGPWPAPDAGASAGPGEVDLASR